MKDFFLVMVVTGVVGVVRVCKLEGALPRVVETGIGTVSGATPSVCPWKSGAKASAWPQTSRNRNAENKSLILELLFYVRGPLLVAVLLVLIDS